MKSAKFRVMKNYWQPVLVCRWPSCIAATVRTAVPILVLWFSDVYEHSWYYIWANNWLEPPDFGA